MIKKIIKEKKMNKKISMITLFVLIMMITKVSAQIYEDFPETPPSYDIGTNRSAKGDGYVKVQAYVANQDQLKFQLLYKELDESGKFIQFNQLPVQSVPEFYLKVHTLHRYQAMIVAYNLLGEISAVSYMISIVPSKYMQSELAYNDSPQSIFSRSKKARSSSLEMLTTIDPAKFPIIEINAEIMYNSTVEEGLSKSDFEVTEDSRYQSIQEVVPPQQNDFVKIADIVFVHDDSGSMSEERDAVKENILSFVQKLESENIDYRIALVPYGGSGVNSTCCYSITVSRCLSSPGCSYTNCSSDPDGTVFHDGIFHDNIVNFKNDLNYLKIYGGTEKAFCAIDKAITQLRWRESTQKFIILLTDEDNDTCSISQTQLLTNLKANNVTCYCLYDSDDISQQNDFDPLSEQTNGKVFDIYDDFSDILKDISADISSKYLIQYQTDNPSSTTLTTQREVQLKAITSYGPIVSTLNYTPNPFLITRTPETIALSDSGQRQQRSLQIVIKMIQNNVTLSAKLYYKNETSNYQSINMTSIGNNLYSTDIPALDVIPKAIHYYITASNGMTTKTLPTSDAQDNPFIIPILPNMAPFLSHQVVTTAIESAPIAIQGRVEDVTNRVERIEFFYKEQGENIYEQLVETPNTTQYAFNFSIPADKVTCKGVAYYINAIDDFGVTTQIGTTDNPNLIEVPCIPSNVPQEIGNVKIYADNFKSVPPYQIIASGNVCIGTTSNDRKLLRTGASLNLYTDSKTIDTVTSNNLYILDIKRSQTSSPELLPLFNGNFEIDCDVWPPKLTYNNGDSILKLINNITFSFPTSTGNHFLLIQEDSVTLKDVFTSVTEGMEATVDLGDITLSQTGNTTPLINVTGQSLSNKRKIKNQKWELENLSFEVDIANEQFKGSGEFSIPGVIEYNRGIPSDFEFIDSPLSLEKIYGNLGFPRSWRQPLMIPSKHTLGILVTNTDSSFFQVNGITSQKTKKLSGNCSMMLYDTDEIIKAVNNLEYFSPIEGDVSVSIHPGKKADLSGNIQFMGYYPMENVDISMGRHIKLKGKLKIPNIAYELSDGKLTKATGSLSGDVNLFLSVYNGELFIRGTNPMFLTMPQGSEWISGGKTIGGMFQLYCQFSKEGIEIANISTSCFHKFTLLNININISNSDKPVVKVTNFLAKLFGLAKRKGRSDRKKEEQFSINESMDQLIVKYFCAEEYAKFSLTLPDGVTYTPVMSPPEYVSNGSYNYGIYFFANDNAHESYFAIQTPPQGGYTITTLNENDIGDHNWVLYGPNSPPSITVNSPSSYSIWDKSSDIQISFTAQDDDDDATISLFYDDDNTGNDGIMIATGISEELSANTFLWKIDDSVQSGSYYIYAKIQDAVNASEYTYSKGKIEIVNPWAPQTPTNFLATPGDGEVSLSWDTNPETDINGYRVYLSDNPSEYTYRYMFNVGLTTSYEIEGLTNGRTYAVAVSAINYSGLESLLTSPVSVEPSGTGTQGSPDLALDKENSSVTSASGKLEGTLTIQARIKNIAEHDSFSARIECYYGQLSQSNLISSQLIATIQANSYLDVLFEIDSDSITSIHDLQYFYINIVDVVLPELNEDNNMDIIVNDLPFVQEIDLSAGLNLICLPNTPESIDISLALNPVLDKINYVASFQNDVWQFFYTDPTKVSNLTNLLPGNGYYIDMTSAATLSINGTIASNTRFLSSAWNLVGLTTRRELSIEDALNSIDGNYSRIWALENGKWQMYDPQYSILSNLKSFKPGLGYFIAISTPSTWTLP